MIIGCQGVELHQSVLLSEQGSEFALAVATSAGLAIAPLQADGNLAPLENWEWSLSDELFALTPLVIEGQNIHLLGLGHAGAGSVFEISLL